MIRPYLSMAIYDKILQHVQVFLIILKQITEMALSPPDRNVQGIPPPQTCVIKLIIREFTLLQGVLMPERMTFASHFDKWPVVANCDRQRSGARQFVRSCRMATESRFTSVIVQKRMSVEL